MHIAVVCFTCKQLALTKPRIEIPRRKSGIWPKSSVNMWKRHPMLELLEAGVFEECSMRRFAGSSKTFKNIFNDILHISSPVNIHSHEMWLAWRNWSWRLSRFRWFHWWFWSHREHWLSGNWRFPTNIRYCKQKFQQSCVIHSSITYRFFICPELVSQPCKSAEK